jgi:hypothetical protein
VSAEELKEGKSDTNHPKTLKQQHKQQAIWHTPSSMQTRKPTKKASREFVAGVTFATAMRACIFDGTM